MDLDDAQPVENDLKMVTPREDGGTNDWTVEPSPATHAICTVLKAGD